jgi:hypothetical protein
MHDIGGDQYGIDGEVSKFKQKCVKKLPQVSGSDLSLTTFARKQKKKTRPQGRTAWKENLSLPTNPNFVF